MKDHDELRRIAIGIDAGAIFTDRNLIGQEHMLGAVFMPLGLASKDQIEALVAVVAPDPEGMSGMFYEWMDKAQPLAVNGMPTFFSVQCLTPEEVAEVQAIRERIAAI